MSVCGEWWWRLRSPSGSWFQWSSPDWGFDYRRSTESKADADATDCEGRIAEFTPGCDLLEVFCDGALAERFWFDGASPDDDGVVRVAGVGLAEALKWRRWQQTTPLQGAAGFQWATVWQEANALGNTYLESSLLGGGTAVDTAGEAGALTSVEAGTLESYVAWAQHRGALYDWVRGDEPYTGRALKRPWVVDYSCAPIGETDASAVVTDIEAAYGSTLESTLRWVNPDADPNCVRQSRRIEFPEITSQTEMQALLDRWGPAVGVAEPLLDNVSLDPAHTNLDDLLPGVWHLDEATQHAGYWFNLAIAEIKGRYGCVTDVTTGFDQGDSEIRRRLRA